MNKQSVKKFMTLIHGGLVLCCALVFALDKVMAFPISTGANPYRAHIVPEAGNVAIYGYDPVAYYIEGRAVKGNAEFEHEFGNVRWRFSSAENRDAFIDSPDVYLPQYGGFCTVCIVEHEGLFDANPKVWTIVKGKLYLNNDLRSREKFRRNASLYIEWADEVWRKLTPPERLDKTASSDAYKIALFPVKAQPGTLALDTVSEVNRIIRSALQENESLGLAYDYEAVPTGGEVVSIEQVWPPSFGPQEPILESVIMASKQLQVDGVVTAWAFGGSAVGLDRGTVEISVIDTTHGTLYRERGFLSELNAMAERTFSEFVDGKRRGKSTTRKIAVFPMEIANPSWSLALVTESAVVGMIKSYLDANESFEISYDYETTPASGPAVNPTQVWTGGFGPQEPQLEVVTKLAEQIGVEGVVMAWVRSADSAQGVDRGRVELYVIDLVQGDIYKESGLVSEVDNMLKIAFSKLRS